MTEWLPNLKDASGPVYIAIVDALASDIRTGRISPGTQLMPQRDLANHLNLSVGTVTKAYAEAERRGLIIGEVGRGTFVRSRYENPNDGATRRINLTLNVPPLTGAEAVLKDAFTELANRNHLAKLLDYLPHQGVYEHRTKIANWLSSALLECAPQNLFVTSGAQHAAWLALTAVAREGDTIVAEQYPYSGLSALAELQHYRLAGIELDDGGAIPESLDHVLAETGAKIVYLTPTFQTATGAAMGESRRKQIAKLLRKHDAYLIEDDVYGFLLSKPRTPISRHAPERSFYLTSYAKMVAPTLRMGSVVVPEKFHSRAITALRAGSWMTSPLLAAVLVHLIDTGDLDEQIESKRIRAAQLSRQVRGALKPLAFPETNGFHYWLPMPEGYEVSDFIAQASARGINIAASPSLPVNQHPKPGVRLCVGGIDNDDDLASALQEISQLVSRREFISVF